MVSERAERCPFKKACAPYARLKTFTAADPGLQTIRQGDAHLSCHHVPSRLANDERLSRLRIRVAEHRGAGLQSSHFLFLSVV